MSVNGIQIDMEIVHGEEIQLEEEEKTELDRELSQIERVDKPQPEYQLCLNGATAAFGLSSLQYVDLRSSRNLYIIGISLFFPLVLCQWMEANPGVINTGIKEVDSTLTVLLSTSILVAGVMSCLLDNLIPGTREERGLIAWAKEMSLKQSASSTEDEPVSSTFDFPFGMDALRRCKWTSSVPFLPTYTLRKTKKAQV